jgi:hypothetical protein
MSCSGSAHTCDCCAGTSVQTPQPIGNLPGLPAIAYRVGTWAAFKESMQARLSSADYPALAPLKTRSDDDFTIAFLDATSVLLDILTFYQERLANESYLRTAVQLRSLTELSRLIGYQPVPGVAASAYLAFTLKSAPGQAPNPATPGITIPTGTRAQSVPTQGQTPQTFETSSDIPAKSDWNALPVQADQPWVPPGVKGVYLSGTTTQLQPGDRLLIVGAERDQWNGQLPQQPGNQVVLLPREQWQLVTLQAVTVDTTLKLTHVSWGAVATHIDQPGAANYQVPPWNTARVFALRQRAALFGHNAPSPYLFVNAALGTASTSATSLPKLITVTETQWTWNSFAIKDPGYVDLDAIYSKFPPQSWVVLISGASAQLYRIVTASTASRADFTISGKVTKLAFDFADTDLSSNFPLQATQVLGQSEELQVAAQPLTWPLYGTTVDLRDIRPDLAGVQTVALSGCSQKVAVASGVTNLAFLPSDVAVPAVVLKPGDLLTVTDPTGLPLDPGGNAIDWSTIPGVFTLRVQDSAGRSGTVNAQPGNLTLADASPTDPVVREFALVSSVTTQLTPRPHTRIQLQSNLQFCYNRAATTVNANVALASHGQSVTEILGNGTASTPNQKFTLRQYPLTFVHAPTPTGLKSTLQVRANSMLWMEVATLYGQGPAQKVFATTTQDNQTTGVQFGDGTEGATLPTGQNNLQASYRVGSGSVGNVAAAAISTLMDRPLGVSGVINPSAASGGQDPQPAGGVRTSAPQTVLTLGRAVSLADYQNYASTFAGIAKAHAIWVPGGPGLGVFLTVAAGRGVALPPGSPTLANLAASLRSYGNPLIPITVVSFIETLFSFSASLHCDPAYVQSAVQAQVLTTLTNAFSFASRAFGQGVGVDEITAVIQSVSGVLAANVSGLTRGLSSTGGDRATLGGPATVAGISQWLAGLINLNRQFVDAPLQLCAALPGTSINAIPQPAEILVIAPEQITLGVLA